MVQETKAEFRIVICRSEDDGDLRWVDFINSSYDFVFYVKWLDHMIILLHENREKKLKNHLFMTFYSTAETLGSFIADISSVGL